MTVLRVVSYAQAQTPGRPPVPFRITGGRVSGDAKADVRWRMSLQLVASPDLVPVDASSLLAPGETEVRVFRGTVGPTGEEAYHPLGVYPLLTSRVEETREGLTASVTGHDRSVLVSGNRWDAPHTVEPGDLGTRIREVLLDRYPQAVTNFVPTPGLTVNGLVLGTSSQNNPWTDLTKMARSGGLELYPDRRGVFVLRPIPDPATAPVEWSLRGGAGGNLLGVNRGLTSERSFSRVVVEAESTGLAAPIRAVAEDTSAPRRRTYFFKSSAISTQAQAQAVADAVLRDVQGLYEDVSFTSLVDEHADVGSVGRITRPSVGADGRYVLEQAEVPMEYDQSMSGTCRGQRVSS